MAGPSLALKRVGPESRPRKDPARCASVPPVARCCATCYRLHSRVDCDRHSSQTRDVECPAVPERCCRELPECSKALAATGANLLWWLRSNRSTSRHGPAKAEKRRLRVREAPLRNCYARVRRSRTALLRAAQPELGSFPTQRVEAKDPGKESWRKYERSCDR